MAQFNYTLPSGDTFTMEAPAGTTQTQADYTFYSQVAAGALVGFVPGQSVTSTTSSLAKFTLSRLDRRTAGVDDTVILAIVNGLPTVNNLPASNGVPFLIDVPLVNPVTQANIAAIATTGFTAPAIGALTNTQVQALMAQVASTVDQPATTATNDTGVGIYGFTCPQLEMAGYVKPGTYQQFLQNGSSTLVDVLSAPGIWTGLNGIYSLSDFLNSTIAQNDAQATLMKNGYASLQAAGVITTPASQAISTVVGTVYTGSNVALTTATATVTNEINSQVAALVTNASQFGTELTAQWAGGLPPVSNVTSNLTSVTGLATVTSSFASVQTAMNTLGKASQFAATASSTLSSGLGILSSIGIANLPGLASVGTALAGLPGLASVGTALAGQIEGKATALFNDLKTNAGSLLTNAEAQANALIANAESQAKALLGQADTLVADVQKAAGFTNTVDRATVDVAMTKLFGSSKIPAPSFGVPDSASISAALDISKAKSVLSGLQGQATGLVSQAQGLASQAQGLASQAQGQANALFAQAKSAVNQVV